MSSWDEIIEILSKNAHEMQDRFTEIMHDNELPGRVVESVVVSINGALSAITGHGTLLPHVPHIPLPSNSIAKQAPPPLPPTFWERAARHVKGHVYIYSFLGGSTLTIVATSLAVHWSPAFRARVFGQLPFLKPVYLNAPARLRRKPLPPIPRPRLTPNGKGRLEAVIVLGADRGTQGREIARQFEKRGFVVIASVSDQAEVEGLERSGNGFIKAIHLDPYTSLEEVALFSRALNTALSLRYPLNSPGDPFAAPSAALQLVAVINCLSLTSPVTPFANLPVPIEAIPADQISASLAGVQTTTLAVLQRVLPLFRTARATARRDIPAPGMIITCLPAPQRYFGTPFSGQHGSLLGLAAGGLASAMDVLRRELALSARDAGVRPVKVVNVDVGFLAEPTAGKLPRTHRGNDVSGRREDSPSPDRTSENSLPALSAEQAEAALPRHLRETYAPALLATAGSADEASRHKRKHLPPHHALADKLIHLVLAKKASHVPDRVAVGAGVTTYYLASLLPTRLIDAFFGFRHRLLMRSAAGTPSQANASSSSRLPRKPLPLPGHPSPEVPSSEKFSSDEKASSESGASTKTSEEEEEGGNGAPLPHESDTILPQYAPSAPGSGSELPSPTGLESASSAFSSGYASESGRGEDDEVDEGNVGSEGSTPSRSTVLGESYVQV